MKKIFLILIFLFSLIMEAQEQKQIPQVSVNGEGKIKVTPDKAIITFGVDNIGKEAAEVKKLNDETVDKVMTFIKKFGIPKTDVQTTAVSLNRNYDYDKKKYTFNASQTIIILLKDISKYDSLMMGLVDNGINNITNVCFESSKMEDLKSEARKLAIKEAKHKAEDFVSVLGQKIGKAILISDNSVQNYFPQQTMFKSSMGMAADGNEPRETLAIGQIEVTANVNVSFLLE